MLLLFMQESVPETSKEFFKALGVEVVEVNEREFKETH